MELLLQSPDTLCTLLTTHTTTAGDAAPDTDEAGVETLLAGILP